jgi:hypothetical protein
MRLRYTPPIAAASHIGWIQVWYGNCSGTVLFNVLCHLLGKLFGCRGDALYSIEVTFITLSAL